MSKNFEQLERGASVIYGACGGIWVMTLHAKPSTPDMLLARPALKSMRDRHPDGFPALTWVLPEAGLSMEPDARHAAADVTKEFMSSIRGMATLVEGEGFGPAAVRAIIAGIDLMSRATAPKKVFSDLAASVAWCATFGREPDRHPSAVERVVKSLVAMREGLKTGA